MPSSVRGKIAFVFVIVGMALAGGGHLLGAAQGRLAAWGAGGVASLIGWFLLLIGIAIQPPWRPRKK